MCCHSNRAFSHSHNQFFMRDFFFAFRGPQEQFGTNSKLSLGCKIGQIRSWNSVFEAKIGLFMMFLYVFTFFIRLSLIFLNIQMK